VYRRELTAIPTGRTVAVLALNLNMESVLVRGVFGGYRRQGDGVRVTGTFHAACREHGGDMDIHAASLEIVREGHAVTHRLNTRRLGIGLALLALAGALELARRRAGPRRS
jgi:hypothetical protein